MSAGLATLADVVIWSNLRAALLVGIVLAALALCRTGGGRERHLLWLTVCLACLALPLLSSALPGLPLPLPRVWPAAIESGAAGAETAAIARPDPDLAMVSTTEAAIVSKTGIAPTGSEAAQPLWLEWLEWLAVDWPAALVALYVAGVTCVLGRYLLAFRRIARLESSMRSMRDADIVALKESLCRELGIRRRVVLLEGDGIASPLTWGCLRPRIALPAAAIAWDPDRMRSALLHELGHVRRCDWTWLWLLRLTAALYWFNPLVGTAVRQCIYEAERACDDLVLGAGGRSSDYAEQLVELMTASRAGTEAALALGGSHFARRVRAILRSPEEIRTMSPKTTRAASCAVVLVAIGLAACQVTGQPVTTADAAAESSPSAVPVAPAAAPVAPTAAPVASAAVPVAPAAAPVVPARTEALQVREAAMQSARAAASEAARAAEFGRQAAEQGRQAARQDRQAAEQLAREVRAIERQVREREVTALVDLQAVIERQAVALREAEVRILNQLQTIAELEQSMNALREQLVSREIAGLAPALTPSPASPSTVDPGSDAPARPAATPAAPTPAVPTPDR